MCDPLEKATSQMVAEMDRERLSPAAPEAVDVPSTAAAEASLWRRVTVGADSFRWRWSVIGNMDIGPSVSE